MAIFHILTQKFLLFGRLFYGAPEGKYDKKLRDDEKLFVNALVFSKECNVLHSLAKPFVFRRETCRFAIECKVCTNGVNCISIAYICAENLTDSDYWHHHFVRARHLKESKQ